MGAQKKSEKAEVVARHSKALQLNIPIINVLM
jgi:hypothetical protein